ncbi:MAG: 2OG-Fe(II) oxygenase [Lysobacteraceae bacterium]
MNATPPAQTRIVALSTDGVSLCWLLPDFLSVSECEAEIAAAQACGFALAGSDFPPSYRNNRRLVRDDAAHADALYARFQTRVTAGALEREADGRHWRPTGVNPRLRYCRYEPGEAFHLHQDGVRHESDGRRSFLTFMIYLDDPTRFEGGATRFFAHGPDGDADGDHPVLLALRPTQGSLIVFDHGLWHDGAEVLAGTKHVLRSDLLFAADSAAASTENHEPAPFAPGHAGYVWKLAALRDGTVASAGRDALVRLWSPDGRLQATLAGHAQSVLAMAQTDSDTFYTLSRDRSLRRWNLRDKAETGCVVAHAAAGLALTAVAGDVISAGADGELRRWRDMHPIASRASAHTGWIWDLAISGSMLASVGEDGHARLWDCERIEPLADLAHPHALRAIAIRDDSGSALLACGDILGHVHLWRCDGHGTWHTFGMQSRHRAAVRALRWLPDGQLGSAGEDGRVLIGQAAPDAVWRDIAHHDNFATDLHAFDDGRLLSAGYDGRLRIGHWNDSRSVDTFSAMTSED